MNEFPTARESYANTVENFKDTVRREVYGKIMNASSSFGFSVRIENLRTYPDWLLHELLAKGYFVGDDTISWEIGQEARGTYYYQTDNASSMYPYMFRSNKENMKAIEPDETINEESSIEKALAGIEETITEVEPEPKRKRK